jgi:hypothetical protein
MPSSRLQGHNGRCRMVTHVPLESPAGLFELTHLGLRPRGSGIASPSPASAGTIRS